jgi:hypothetical protein
MMMRTGGRSSFKPFRNDGTIHVRHSVIDDDRINRLNVENVDRSTAIWRGENLMPFTLEEQFAQFEAVFFVIYNIVEKSPSHDVAQ